MVQHYHDQSPWQRYDHDHQAGLARGLEDALLGSRVDRHRVLGESAPSSIASQY